MHARDNDRAQISTWRISRQLTKLYGLVQTKFLAKPRTTLLRVADVNLNIACTQGGCSRYVYATISMVNVLHLKMGHVSCKWSCCKQTKLDRGWGTNIRRERETRRLWCNCSGFKSRCQQGTFSYTLLYQHSSYLLSAFHVFILWEKLVSQH